MQCFQKKNSLGSYLYAQVTPLFSRSYGNKDVIGHKCSWFGSSLTAIQQAELHAQV